MYACMWAHIHTHTHTHTHIQTHTPIHTYTHTHTQTQSLRKHFSCNYFFTMFLAVLDNIVLDLYHTTFFLAFFLMNTFFFVLFTADITDSDIILCTFCWSNLRFDSLMCLTVGLLNSKAHLILIVKLHFMSLRFSWHHPTKTPTYFALQINQYATSSCSFLACENHIFSNTLLNRPVVVFRISY